MLIIITLLIICLGSLTNQWDARSLWLFKAKRIYLDLSVISIKDNYAIFSPPDYPNIGPAFIAGFSKCFGFWIPPTDVSDLPLNYKEIYAERGYDKLDFNVFNTCKESGLNCFPLVKLILTILFFKLMISKKLSISITSVLFS